MKIMTWNIVRVYLFLLIKVLTRIRMAYGLYRNTIRTQYAELTGWVAQAPVQLERPEVTQGYP